MMPNRVLRSLPHRLRSSSVMLIHFPSVCEHHPILFSRFSNLNLNSRGFGGNLGFFPLCGNTFLAVRKLSTHSSRIESQSGSDRGKVSASKSLVDDESELSDWVSQLNSTSSFSRNDRKDPERMGRGEGFDRDRGGRGFGTDRGGRGFGTDKGGRGFGDRKDTGRLSSTKNSKWNSSSKRRFDSVSGDDESRPRMHNFRDSKSKSGWGNDGWGKGSFGGNRSPRRGINNSAAKPSILTDEEDSDDCEVGGGERDFRGSKFKSTRNNDGWARRSGGRNAFPNRNVGESASKTRISTDGEVGHDFRGSKSKFNRSSDGWGRKPVGKTVFPQRDIGKSKEKFNISKDEDTEELYEDTEELESEDETDLQDLDSDDLDSEDLDSQDLDSEDLDGQDLDSEDNSEDGAKDDSKNDNGEETYGDEDDSDKVENDNGRRIISSFVNQSKGTSSSTSASTNSLGSYLSETSFDQCEISPLSLKALKDAGYEKMTVVQAATLPVILNGKDVLARAKTGTGKTVAFLLPSIEVVVKAPTIDREERRTPIIVLVICPTRELANQAAKEASTLLKYHPSINTQVVIGGTRLAFEQKQMQVNPSQILVATPGRLRDHIENTPSFVSRLKGLKVLIFDEADHLLDMGFVKDMEAIVAVVPKQRQTLMFSATFPEEIHHICQIALKRDHEYINTVEEGTEDTHTQVKQAQIVAPLDKHFNYIYALLKEHISNDVEYKVLVFCITAMQTSLVATLLKELGMKVLEIHSRKSQNFRTRVSDEFRRSKGLILVTSDVSARGVDYPDVTLVLQVGSPSDREQYIHRLGRTGRKGKTGQGVLLLAPWEDFFISSIKDLPLEKAPIPSIDPQTSKKVEKALSHVDMVSKQKAYQAWLGYYNSVKSVGKDKGRLVQLANEFSRSMGLDTPPSIPKLILSKMGLKNVPGLRSS